MYRSARLMCLRAHELDPDDALVTYAFLRYVTPELRKQKFGSFIQEHPWFYENYQRELQNSSQVEQEMEEHKAYELEGEPKPVTLHLVNLMSGANVLRGLGLEMKIQNGRSLRLLLDTGASGFVITQRAVDKAGLSHLGSTEAWGIGDKGVRKGFLAVADTCSVGALSYKTCIFEALEGKDRIAGDEDGLIGADFFENYLIHLDFQRHEMKLTPLPSRPPNPVAYDRTVPAGEESFTPVWRLGHHLYISTMVNRKSVGLFLLDTGASLSNIDSTFARPSTKLHGDEYLRVRGVSGQVKNVFEADRAELAFARFRQSNLGLTAFNLNNSPRHQEVRMSGILGLPVLAMFRLDIDYRNGLVNFDYVMK
jgi:predicted aspartyl protease